MHALKSSFFSIYDLGGIHIKFQTGISDGRRQHSPPPAKLSLTYRLIPAVPGNFCQMKLKRRILKVKKVRLLSGNRSIHFYFMFGIQAKQLDYQKCDVLNESSNGRISTLSINQENGDR